MLSVHYVLSTALVPAHAPHPPPFEVDEWYHLQTPPAPACALASLPIAPSPGLKGMCFWQVEELKGTFGGLKLDVEAMFMQMPSVDLDELGAQLEAMQHHQQASKQYLGM